MPTTTDAHYTILLTHIEYIRGQVDDLMARDTRAEEASKQTVASVAELRKDFEAAQASNRTRFATLQAITGSVGVVATVTAAVVAALNLVVHR